MRANPLREKLGAGEVGLGLFAFEFGTLGIVRIAEAAGSDFVLFDMEHTAWTGERLRSILAAARASSIPSLVRVPSGERHFVASALDAGASGVVVPMVESAEQAREIVAAAKYPPSGRRGFGALYADEFVDDDVPATLRFRNREELVFAQVETVAGLEDVEQIAAVDGVDVIWMGQYDLTISLGIPGMFDHPDYLAAVRRMNDAAAACNKPTGMCVSSFEQAAVELARGYRCFAFDDISLLDSSMRTTIEKTRMSARGELAFDEK